MTRTYILKNYKNKEAMRENLEYEAGRLRRQAEILNEKALTMEEMARKFYFNLELIEPDAIEVKE